MKWFYMARNDVTRHGVADEAKLAEMARSWQIDPEDLIWNCENGTRWVVASSLPGLFTGREKASHAGLPVEPDQIVGTLTTKSRKVTKAGLLAMAAAVLLLVLLILVALLRR